MKKSHLQKTLRQLKSREEKMLSNELASIEEVEALERQSLPSPRPASSSAAEIADVFSFDWSSISPEVLAELGFGGGTPQPS